MAVEEREAGPEKDLLLSRGYWRAPNLAKSLHEHLKLGFPNREYQLSCGLVAEARSGVPSREYSQVPDWRERERTISITFSAEWFSELGLCRKLRLQLQNPEMQIPSSMSCILFVDFFNTPLLSSMSTHKNARQKSCSHCLWTIRKGSMSGWHVVCFDMR